MSKSETLRNPFWEDFRFKVQMLIERPKNKGVLSEEEAQQLQADLALHDYGRPEEGMQLRWYWAIDRENGRVVACRYTLFGPPVLLAIADMAALLVRNKTLEEIEKINYKSLEYFLRDNPVDPALPPERRFALTFVLRSLASAVAAQRGERPEASPLVCECAGIDKATVEAVIRDFDLQSVEEITDYTRAGAFCKECIAPGLSPKPREYTLSDLLKATRQEMEEERSTQSSVPEKPFKEMSLDEKRAAITAVIDRYIRDMLVMDGGDMEILDVKENGEHTDLYIRYLGACSGCASASTGTLFAIEGILKQKLDPNLRVLPL